MSQRWWIVGGLGAALWLMAGMRAHAQDPAADGGAALVEPGETRAEGELTASPAEGAQPTTASDVPLVWQRWALFDPFVDPHEGGLAFEWTEWREIDRSVRSRGATIAIAAQVSTVRGRLASTIRNQTIALRLLEGRTYAIGLAQYDLLGSLDFGVVRLGAGAGILPISLDYAHGDFSLGLASPRAVASVSFKVGILRVAIGATTSYLPRVWGRGHVITQSLGLEILLEKRRNPRLGRHPLSVR